MDRQNKAAAAEIRRIVSDRTLSVHGKYFRVGYTLAPGTSGFRWRGVCFRDTAELIRQSSGPGGTSDALSQMLADRCFSFLLELRGIKTPEQKRNLEAMRRLEQWEKEEKGKGAARFIMQMGRADQKGFYADGKFYHSFGQLFQAYQDKGVQLKKISGRILHDSMFQGWMWSQGFEMAAAAACRETMGDERAFFALLSLGEKTCSDSGKKTEPQTVAYVWCGRSRHVAEEPSGVVSDGERPGNAADTPEMVGGMYAGRARAKFRGDADGISELCAEYRDESDLPAMWNSAGVT